MVTDHPGGEVFRVPYPPREWHYLYVWGDAHAFAHRSGLRLLIDCEKKDDGRRWVHISVSRKAWTPSHEDMALVKAAFIGDRYAYAIWPPSSEYVNIHPHCLHLWALAEGENGRVLPEFSAVLDGIGKSI